MRHLIFDTNELLHDALQERAGGEVVLVKPGDRYQEQPGGGFTLRPEEPEDYRKLLAALGRAGKLPERILHRWCGRGRFDGGRELESQLTLGVLSLFHLTQAFVEAAAGQAMRLVYLYACEPDEVRPEHAAVAAFARTVRLEHPRLQYKTVELRSAPCSPGEWTRRALDAAWRELEDGATQVEARYSDGKRFHRQLEVFVPEAASGVQPLPLREGGVYLVTGGLGALGLIFARHLVERLKARVVLAGRSAPDADQTAELGALGPSVAYLRADVAKRDEVLRLTSETRSRFGAIHGVIHSAGLIRDARLAKKTLAQLREVLAPKLFGAVHLDEATAGDPLDCFVLFSSIAALLGNIGQCDYAYANSFLDHFAEWREGLRVAGHRSGRTQSINWALWKEGGMRIDAETEKMMTSALGMQPLSTATGLEFFAAGLAQPHPQLLVIEGQADKVERLLGIRQPPRASPPPPVTAATAATAAPPATPPAATAPAAAPAARSGSSTLQRLQKDLVGGLVRILKISEADADLDVDMSGFGFDSITFTTFGNDINKAFHLDITPVVFFEYATIRALSEHLYEEHREHFDAFYGGAAAASAAADRVPAASAAATAAATATATEAGRGLAVKPKLASPAVVEVGRPARVDEPIAIIGISGVMPQSVDLAAFWNHLAEGDDLITEVPQDRWDWRACHGDPFREVDKTNIRWGGFISDVDKFDALFFGISPREAEQMDPQQRIFLEVVWKAIEDAGYRVSQLSSARTGLFAGVGGIDYHDLLLQHGAPIEAHSVTGMMHSVLVNRISYLLNLRGPSEPVETACSSTLVAIHRAVEAIRNGDCELAIAGGVHVMLGPGVHIGLSKGGMLTEDGRCKTFDKKANGYVRGEGAGAVVLKPLGRAEADGDHIYGLIRGSAVNHGGKVNSLTTPNPHAQADVIVTAMERAGVDPATVTYIETHGTGTALGDPIEINGLKKAYKQLYQAWDRPAPPDPHCGLGSVKTNIGHLEFVSGLAGVLKILLSLRNKHLPATIHFEELNPYIQLGGSPFFIVSEGQPWDALPDGRGGFLPRRAGVSSFGFGGVNAHVVIEEYAPPLRPAGDPLAPQLIVLSARNEARLRAQAGQLLEIVAPLTPSASAPDAPASREDEGDRGREAEARRGADEIEDELRTLIARLLHLDASDLDPSDVLCDCGMDAWQFRALDRRIQDDWSVALPDALSERSTVREVATWLAGALPAGGVAKAKPAGSAELLPPPPTTSDLRLDDLAYTLQTGREEMEERLALEVSSISELAAQLAEFVRGGAAGNWLRGNSREARGRGELYDGEEGREFIASLLRNRRLSAAGRLWASGVALPWDLLHSGQTPARISLPTYPFARERYWIPQPSGAPETRTASEATRLHPLLERNTSTLREQRYTTGLSGRESFLRDHMVFEQKVLPGTVYLEMARAAGALAAERAVVRIEDVRWLAPFIAGDAARDVHIRLVPDAGAVLYEVASGDHGKGAIPHARGRLVFDGDAAPLEQVVDLPAVRQRCSSPAAGAEVYRRFREAGIVYGATFQSIVEIYTGRDEALARLELPPGARGGARDLVLPPALLDGALQTAAGLLDASALPAHTIVVPFAAAAIDLTGPCPDACWAHARRAAPGVAHDGALTLDLCIIDGSGRALVRFEALTLRTYQHPTRARSPALPAAAATRYFESAWEESPLPTGDDASHDTPILILAGDLPPGSMGDLLRAVEQRTPAGSVMIARSGESFAVAPDGRSYSIDASAPADYRRLLGALAHRGRLPRRILHLWSLSAPATEVAGGMAHGLPSVFHLSQALLEQKVEHGVRLLYVHTDPSGAGHASPEHAAVGGFARSLRVEDPRFALKTAMLEAGNGAGPLSMPIIESLLSELASDSGVEIRLAAGRRYVRGFRRLTVTGEPDGRPVFRQGGVYLITGGAGGLGSIIAGQLAREAQAKLILAGRSDETRAIRDRLRALEAAGAEVLYVKADVSRRADVEILVSRARARFGGLHGIIHAAGVLSDRFVANKTPDEIARVLAPKVDGCRHLDQLTQSDPLDFFVLFSSLAALTGNIGQSDYAAANAYLDAFAAAREGRRKAGQRNGRTLSINWPLWRDGGMGGDPAVRERLLRRGLVPLESTEGGAALVEALRLPVHQVAVLRGDPDSMLDLLAPPAARPAPVPAAAPSPPAADLQARTVQFLKHAVAEALRLPADRIHEDERLERYGIDSIMVVNLHTRLEHHFEALPVALFFEYQTLRELAGYFVKHHAERLERLVGISAPDSAVTEPTAGAPEPAPPVPGPSLRDREGARFFANPMAAEARVELVARDEIAIIGVAGRYPMAPDLDRYWRNLAAGRDCITEIPADRWDHSRYFSPERGRPDKIHVRWGGFLDEVDRFDPLFFNISPREAEFLDPQERLFLETAWHALEDAGYTPETFGGEGGRDRRVGVFAGVMYGEYQLLGAAAATRGRLAATSSSYASIANRVSYFFNFRGPSLAVDTMCSSSLTSIHLACEAIRDGSCRAAIAGGVNLSVHPNKYIILAQAGFAASDGRCRSFGDGGDGYVPGEGVGAVVLKPLSQARSDGDHIYAVIRASAINHGGRAAGYTVPNPVAQYEVIRDVLARSRIHPETISYVEAHGTGTSLGDPIEMAGLTRAFREQTDRKQVIPVGSVKSNIGHLEAAAGIAAVTKVLLQMKHGQLVPSLHAAELNPRIDFAASPFFVQRELGPWTPPDDADGRPLPRRAGISSFGAGGSNAHLILEQHELPPSGLEEPASPLLFVFSAPDARRLRAQVERMLDHLGDGGRAADIAYTLQVGRRAFLTRLAIRASDLGELRSAAAAWLERPETAATPSSRLPWDRIIEGQVDADLGDRRDAPPGASLPSLLERHDLDALARLWVEGYAIPWAALHTGTQRRRVSLPGCVFERRRCWIEPGPAEDVAGTGQAPIEVAGGSGEGFTHRILKLLQSNRITEEQAYDLIDTSWSD